MALNIPPPKDLAVIIIIALMIGGCADLVRQYMLLPEPTYESCWYEVKYLHVSGREITKPIYCDCNGFTHYGAGGDLRDQAHMTIFFSNGEHVRIYGATDILSVAKKKEQ